MNIQSKLSLTYIVLLSLGVVAISSYAILSIRSFLLSEAIQKFENDAHTFATSFVDGDQNQNLFEKAKFVADLTGYNVALFDSAGDQLISYPDTGLVQASEFLNDRIRTELNSTNKPLIINRENLENLIAFEGIRSNTTEARFLRISQPKDELYAAEASIRHLIYGAMIGSILVVVIVSIYFAGYLSKPITQLKEAAQEISEGNLDKEIDLDRQDEFGTLAGSLNQMAQKLKDDNEQLKRLNEKQNQFFADITHEIRNPLHSIAGSLEMIDLENLPEEKKKQYHKNARKQIQRIVRLFEDIKTLQRYDYDSDFIQMESFNIQDLIKEVAAIYQTKAEEKGIDLKLAGAKQIEVYADRNKIEQVLDNLLSNAVKYTPQGEVIISAKKMDEKAEISVKDTGIGIGEEHLERLFDRFYRTDKARSRDKGGTGLGLAVVKGILRAHGAKIDVQSEPENGSEFKFYLSLNRQ